uniref:Uncharacterized protein n=1 Tax=Romanomermis culicivorax TaxID=13658 RepID=A0A915L852_ROMCU
MVKSSTIGRLPGITLNQQCIPCVAVIKGRALENFKSLVEHYSSRCLQYLKMFLKEQEQQQISLVAKRNNIFEANKSHKDEERGEGAQISCEDKREHSKG